MCELIVILMKLGVWICLQWDPIVVAKPSVAVVFSLLPPTIYPQFSNRNPNSLPNLRFQTLKNQISAEENQNDGDDVVGITRTSSIGEKIRG